jgi:hypothetical protein
MGRPAAADVETRAAALVADLDRWLAAARAAGDAGELPPLPSGLPAELTRRLAEHAPTADWDAVAAHYLGCAAMHHAAGGPAGPVKRLRAELRFAPGFDGPPRFDREKRDRLRGLFDELRGAK